MGWGKKSQNTVWQREESDRKETRRVFSFSQVAQTVKYLPAMWEIWVWSLHWEGPLEKGMPPHSSILAWRIPLCLQCGRSGFDPCIGKVPWRRECHPTPVFLPGESHGQMSLADYSPWDHRVRQDWATNTFTSYDIGMLPMHPPLFTRSGA